MIIVGVRKVKLKTVDSYTPCPSCQTQGQMKLTIYSRHLHFFWIPLFPIGKTAMAHCGHCKYAMYKKEMPTQLQREYADAKVRTRPRLWQFSGTALFIILFIWSFYAYRQDRKEELKFIENPQVNDVYYEKLDFRSYSSLKVVQVTSDSVYVISNLYEVNKRRKVDEIDKAGNYGDEWFGYSRVDLRKKYDDREIYDIHRN